MARKGKSSFTQKEVSQVGGGHPPGQPEEGEGTAPERVGGGRVPSPAWAQWGRQKHLVLD